MAFEASGTALPHHVPQLSLGEARDHTVHFYEDDQSLVRIVAAFADEAFHAGGSAVVIATAPHLRGVEVALEARGYDVAGLSRAGKLATADAEETLERFMVGDLPDPDLFRAAVEPLIARALDACGGAVPPRVFGEMVNVLWQRGNAAGTRRLEELWSALVRERPFSLLCAYLVKGFAAYGHAIDFQDICADHSSVLPSARYAGLDPDEKSRYLANLERRARLLEAEVERRNGLEEERARLYEGERWARAEVALLYRLTDAANRAETLDQVYEAALDGIADALGVGCASILLLEADGVMRFKAWRGLSESYRAAVEGHSPWPADDPAPTPILCEDVRTDERTAGLREVYAREGIGAVGFLPLRSGGRLVGKLTVCHPRAYAFTEEEKRLAGAIADQIAFAMDRKLAALERERLLGVVGHDLRNPLSAITMSAAALLKREPPDGADAKPLHRIVASAKRMERIIAQLLEFAQTRHGRGIPVHPVPVDLVEIARNVLDELEAVRPDRRLSLEVEGDAAGRWDPDLLGEVLSNLVGNAIQHGGEGPTRVRIRGAERSVVVEVQNDGAPIPPEVLPHLFDPFRRGRAPEGARSQGVGLGLFITREIVHAHRGTIEVTSTEAEGTTFAVTLPRSRAG